MVGTGRAKVGQSRGVGRAGGSQKREAGEVEWGTCVSMTITTDCTLQQPVWKLFPSLLGPFCDPWGEQGRGLQRRTGLAGGRVADLSMTPIEGVGTVRCCVCCTATRSATSALSLTAPPEPAPAPSDPTAVHQQYSCTASRL
jgi:hypothetical protein